MNNKKLTFLSYRYGYITNIKISKYIKNIYLK